MCQRALKTGFEAPIDMKLSLVGVQEKRKDPLRAADRPPAFCVGPVPTLMSFHPGVNYKSERGRQASGATEE